MSKRVHWLLAILVIASLLLAACGPTPEPEATSAPEATSLPAAPPEPSEEPFKVGFVYVAPIGDLGWTWAHEQGRLLLEDTFGDGIETAYIENVPEGPDAERVIRDFAEKGYDLVVTTSFGYMDPTATVAEEYPETWFVHVSGYKTAENLSTIFGRMYQPRFLSGLVAGKATETNKIGYVAAFPIPEVIRGINAFTLGVRTANPEATVHVVWTNTWFGPPEEKEAAEALLDQGIDVIAQHQDTTEPQKAAAERGAVSIGYDSDMSTFVGDTVLTSPIWNWGIKYLDIVQRIMDGTYSTESYWGGMDDGIVALAPLSDRVSAETEALVDDYEAQILGGEWDVFCGPIQGQGGELAIPQGTCMTDQEMLNMSWFVDGVEGEAPEQPPVAEGGDEGVGELPSAAFVYVGPTGDLGWTYAHDQGRLALEEMGVETAYAELVPEGPDSERVIRDFAEKGYDIIFATSFGFMDSVMAVAAEYPDTIFEHCTGYLTAENVRTYDGRGYQGWYLAGIVAGEMTENNVLGYIAPYPIPEVVRNMNAFTMGARSVNPDVEVHPIWIFAWVDPPKERDAAAALYDTGADVIARESDSTEPDKLAQENGIYVIGYNSDVARDQSPDAFLTAPVWHWDVFYTKAVEEVAAGTWTNTPVWWGMQEGILSLAPIADFVPQEVKDLVAQEQERILSGEFDVFEGPIYDNTGTLRVDEGETMSDEAKLSFDWLVEGVIGEIPE